MAVCATSCLDVADILENSAKVVEDLQRAAVVGTDLNFLDVEVVVEIDEGSCNVPCGSRRRLQLVDNGGEVSFTMTITPFVSTPVADIFKNVEENVFSFLEEVKSELVGVPVLELITNSPTSVPTATPTTAPTASNTTRVRWLEKMAPKLGYEDYDEDDAFDSNEIKHDKPGSISVGPQVIKKQSELHHLQDAIHTGNFTGKESMFKKDFLLPIYWVNLDRSVARRIQMENMFSNLTATGHPLDPVRVPAKSIQDLELLLEEGRFIPNGIEIVPTDGEESWLKHQRKQYSTIEVACLLSHLYAVLQAYQDGHEVALVLEDDAVLKDEMFSNWQEYAKMAPSDWKILQWATSNDAVLKHATQYEHDLWITWQPEYYCAAAYMISREGMEEVLKKSLKQTEDGTFYWRIDEPELIVADELVYYLAGGAYTSTFPWISTNGLDSTFGESHPVFETEEFVYEQRRIMKRQDSILILMSCRLSDETQIVAEFNRLKTDVEVFAMWNSNFRWIVNAVIADERLVPIFEEQAFSLKNPNVEIRSHVDSKPFNKFGLVADLIDEMDQFDYVLIKDNGMRFSGFPWNTFMEKKGDSVISGALHQNLEESLARNLGKPKRQYYEFHEGQMWKYFSVPEYTSLSPIPTLFIEHGFALLESEFSGWFFNQVLDTHFLSQRSDWGIDKMWCGAAKTFRPNSPACTLIPIPVTHDDTQQITVSEDSEILGQKAFQHFRETPLFRDWMDSMTGWEHFIGDNSSLKTVMDRCRAFLYSGKRNTADLSQCASLIVEGHHKMPGNLYACGWDVLGLNIFPDYTYQGAWQPDGKFYTEKDVLVVDLHMSCVSTGDWQKSFAYMAEHFPGKIMYVNGESHGNIDDYAALNVGKRSFQIGPWHEDKYEQSTQTYVAAMTLFVVDEEQWPWIFDPTQRQINNGKNEAIAYFVSNCIEFRQNAAKELSNIVELHHGGGCHVESEKSRRVETEHHHWTSNWKLFRDYKYCLVMENKAQSGYITEKIVMAFLGGCIPIYYGTDEVFDLFNPEAFVFYDPSNPDPALEKMRRFEEDPEAYHQALKEPILRDGSTTIEKYFSLSDEAPGNSVLKSRIRTTMGLGDHSPALVTSSSGALSPL